MRVSALTSSVCFSHSQALKQKLKQAESDLVIAFAKNQALSGGHDEATHRSKRFSTRLRAGASPAQARGERRAISELEARLRVLQRQVNDKTKRIKVCNGALLLLE